jgi:hypothetical protein
MASKTKKVIKAHGRYMKAQEDLKRQALQFLIFKQLLPSYWHIRGKCRSQARFERLADLLASDTLKPCIKEHGSSGNANEDQYNAYEMSPNDQRQNHVSTYRKRSIILSTSEEAKIGKHIWDYRLILSWNIIFTIFILMFLISVHFPPFLLVFVR